MGFHFWQLLGSFPTKTIRFGGANRGKRGRGEPAASHGIEWHRERVRRDVDAAAEAGYPQRAGYVDDVIRGQQLARQIAAMDEGPERDALIGEWKTLP